ncbi:hypothetical protein [Pleomorphomonas koreensis]|uniref:hypothetical protein n=1 Tax=Pleomorphomonas koreensis TaxID=257440 RepID=UPI001FDECB63|nr:hypothetical protein [Pleomorphomonas koreensis]
MATLFVAGSAAGMAQANVPFFNAACPGRVEVHADEGGPIYVNGKEARLKRFNDNYYEARSGNVTISLSIRPDGSPDISYTGKGGANGVCQIKSERSADDQPERSNKADQQPADRRQGVDTTAMPAFCRGEASAEFDRRPSEITTNMAFKSGNRYVVQGNFPDQERTTFFNCWFDADGNFVSVN